MRQAVRLSAMAVLRTAWLLTLALSLLGAARAGEPNPALDAFRRRAQVRLAEAALASHDVDAAQRRLEDALALARKAKEAPPDLGLILERLGDVYVRRNQLSGGRSFYIRALQSAGDDEAKRRALDRLGRLAVRRGRPAEAVDWFRQAADLAPDARAFLHLGEALLSMGRSTEASAAFEQSVTLAPPADRIDVEEAIARRLRWFTQDRYAADAHFDRALELRLQRSEDKLRTLRTAALAADDDRAEAYLAPLADLDPALAHRLRARRLSGENIQQAIAEQQAAVALYRGSEAQPSTLAAALEELAKLEERRGNDAIAAGLRREALDLRPDRPSPPKLEAVAALAANLERTGDPDAASELWEDYTSALENQPGAEGLAVAAADERFGDFLLRQARYSDAAERYEHAVEEHRAALGRNDGGLQPILAKLADALRLDGREDEAKRSETALALLTIERGLVREPPRGPRNTGTWLSEPFGLAFIGLAFCGATFGLVWAGWATVARLQPEIEAGFRPAAAGLADAPTWKPITLPETRYPLSFLGRGGTLFGIWSVNMALTLLTLGLYFFWGKVRVRRYFWGQADLAGDRFAFHGVGRELLFGWLKAAPILALLLWGPGLLNLASENPRAGLYGAGIAVLLAGTLWPLAEVGASRYRLSRTSWRAIRFSFQGDAWPYMKLWLRGMALWILTLGLWAPFFDAARRRYLMTHTRFGDAHFECDGYGRDLFAIHLVSWALFLPTMGASYFWYKALSERYFWSRTQLVHNEGQSRAKFECSLTGLDLLVVWIQTMVILALTLGLGWPWARVWEARLRLQTIALVGDFRPGRIRQSVSDAGATGEGAADFLGLDFGFFS